MAEAASPSNHFVGNSSKRHETLLQSLFLLLVAATGAAQSVLTGTVRNSGGTGVEFVSVGVEGDSRGTVSDINDL